MRKPLTPGRPRLQKETPAKQREALARGHPHHKHHSGCSPGTPGGMEATRD